jgi:hypothetical protein
MQISAELRLALAGRYSEAACHAWQQRAAAAGLDWPALADEATGLGLAPLLYDACKRTAVAGMPDAVADSLHDHYLQTGLRNTLALTVFHRIL